MLLGITGHMQSGKSETAKHLILNHSFLKLAFADTLKQSARLIYNLSQEQLYGHLKDYVDQRYNLTPRYILQILGTEVARSIHKDTWILALDKKLALVREREKDTNKELNIVIDDVRFTNEAKYIKDSGGYIIGIHRTINQGNHQKDNHQSETEMNKIEVDAMIFNHYTLKELHENIDRELEYFYGL